MELNLEEYLHVVLKRKAKDFREVTAGAPEWFVFAVILFNTFISDLCRHISKLHLTIPDDL